MRIIIWRWNLRGMITIFRDGTICSCDVKTVSKISNIVLSEGILFLFILLIKVCSSWSLGSNQSWCFLSGLPRYVLAVLYTTCCRAAHYSSGVEFPSPPIGREHCPSLACLSLRLPDSENLVSHRAAMSMLYLASSIATSAVCLSGRLAPSRSRRVLTFHCAIISSCLLCLLLPCWLFWKMRSSSAVLGNPGDGQSSMEFRAVVHFMEAASKKCWSAAGFCKLLATLSRETNRGLQPARTGKDRRKLFIPAVAGREMLGVPYINRPWCCHCDMVFWLGFAPLVVGSVKNLYHKAVVYNSAWQGRQTPWGIAIPEVLQYLHTIKEADPKNEGFRMLLQCYSKSWKCPIHFNYQQQQLSVACVWPTWCNHSLATASHASNESLDSCYLKIVPLFSEGISQFHECSWLDWMSQNCHL